MTKIWPVKMMSKPYKIYDPTKHEIVGPVPRFSNYWLVECSCTQKTEMYRTRRADGDLDHCPECKAPGEIAEEPWFMIHEEEAK